MRIAIATVQAPFIQGGADLLASGLATALRRANHEVDIVSMPFRFFPATEVERAMRSWEQENLEAVNGIPVDLVICLKFPTYYLRHPWKVVWLMHQHRTVYELWRHGEDGRPAPSPDEWQLRRRIHRKDREHLGACSKVCTIAKTVSARLLHFNQLRSYPLYHPPPLADSHFAAPAEPFIFFPSRLESHKRQHLLVEALRLTKTPIRAVLAGEGGQHGVLDTAVARSGLDGRVKLVGRLSESELLDHYARCLAVFFGPYDEDYGYVTLEAMLSSKPVITCSDSGGPLEFVLDESTGLIVEPTPAAIARAIDRLTADPDWASKMGDRGREHYRDLDLSWESVVRELTS